MQLLFGRPSEYARNVFACNGASADGENYQSVAILASQGWRLYVLQLAAGPFARSLKIKIQQVRNERFD